MKYSDAWEELKGQLSADVLVANIAMTIETEYSELYNLLNSRLTTLKQVQKLMEELEREYE